MDPLKKPGKAPIPLKQHLARRVKENRDICAGLKAYFDKKNIMTWDEFSSRYAILFSSQLYQSKELEEEKTRVAITNLSNEFLNRIDPYRELYIVEKMVEDLSQAKILHVFPAIFTPVKPMINKAMPCLAAYANLVDKQSDKPWEVDRAMDLLMEGIQISQDKQQVVANAKKFMDQAQELHKQNCMGTVFLGPGKFAKKSDTLNSQNTSLPDKNPSSTEPDADDLLNELGIEF